MKTAEMLHALRWNFIAASTILVKPVILRGLGPVNDGSDVHSSPGHSN